MDKRIIRNAVLVNLAAMGTKFVPAGISARHVHLSREDLDFLFGPGYELRPKSPLSQPEQFASEEQVTVTGPKGEIKGVRVLGPVRGKTQVELAITDARKVGIKPVIRLSGDIDGTPGCILTGPKGQLEIKSGVIVAARHLHLSDEQAAAYGLKNGDSVALRMDGPRPGVLENVICRVGPAHDLEVHLDTDEANALCISTGELLQVVMPHAGGEDKCSCGGGCSGCSGKAKTEAPAQPGLKESEPMDLVTERVVEDSFRQGIKVIRCLPKGIITDAARDRAMSLEIQIKK